MSHSTTTNGGGGSGGGGGGGGSGGGGSSGGGTSKPGVRKRTSPKEALAAATEQLRFRGQIFSDGDGGDRGG